MTSAVHMPQALSPSPFDLHIQGVVGHLAVRRFRVLERISTPYLTEIDLDAALLGGEAIAVGTRTKLTSPRGHGPGRTFHGVVTSVERRGRDVDGASRYRLFVEPLFATLKHTRHRRIFHDKTSVAVAEHILREHGVPYRLRVLEGLPVHTHRIQYDESDLAFVERILFEEGVFYFFDHPAEEASDDPDATNLGKTEVLVLCDTAQYYPRVEPVDRLVHRDFAMGDVVTGDETTAFDIARAERARPQAFLVRGRDPQRPVADLGDHDDRRARGGELASGSEDPARRVFSRRPRLVYESDGTLEDRPPTVPTARRLQDEARADAVELQGSSLNPYLMPGRVVRLEGLEGEPEDLVIVAIEHLGEAPRDFSPGPSATPYRNELIAAPAATTLRPARRSKPRVDGFDAAVVVGPEGQEIHTDEHGRVKVHFLWDLESAYDEKASAWLRVMQAWGGAGFGAQFLPRVGMEVMVAFVAGDVDRPIVAGCVHNGASPPPFKYPEERAMSGIRTRTSPGGGGLNEIVFDDAAGKERLSIRSDGHIAIHSRGEQSITSGGGTRESTASRRTRIEQEDFASVGGTVRRELGDSRAVHIAKDDVIQVGRDQAVDVERHCLHRVGGRSSEEVGGSYDFTVGASDDGGAASLRVNGPVISNVRDRVLVVSEHSVFIQVKETRLEIDASGIRMSGGRITMEADRIDLVGGGASLLLAGSAGLNGGTVVVSSKGAQLKLDADAHLDGAKVLLNCGPGSPIGAAAGTSSNEPGTLTFEVTNPETFRGQEVIGTFLGPDGTTVERPIGSDGKVVFEGMPGDRWTLIDVRAGKTSWAKRGE